MNIVMTEAHAANIKTKRNQKKKGFESKQRVEHLINSLGKRTVVLLNPSFFYFFNPFFVIRNCFVAPIEHSAILNWRFSERYNLPVTVNKFFLTDLFYLKNSIYF